MSVLIKDMEMPKEGYIDVRIKCNGTASFAIADNPYIKAVEAVPVPPHGRLGDLDEIERYRERLVVDADKIKKGIRYVVDTKYIKDAPTIIPAEKGK